MTADFDYKKYSLEHLEDWLHDALNCEDLTPQDIYDTLIKCVDENVEYHKKYLTKNIEFLSLLKGHRPFEIDTSLDDIDPSYDYTATGEKFPRTCDKDDPSPECKKDWTDFWEETYYPEESKQYTEEELNAMCERAASDEERNKCREYNLREAEYYNKRAELDYSYSKMIADGWTMTADGFWIKE